MLLLLELFHRDLYVQHVLSIFTLDKDRATHVVYYSLNCIRPQIFLGILWLLLIVILVFLCNECLEGLIKFEVFAGDLNLKELFSLAEVKS